jgi:hypothetical protein
MTGRPDSRTVRGVGYGNERASDQNIPFAFDTALAAARDCWALAGEVRHHDQALGTDAGRLASWTGPKKLQLDEKVGGLHRDAETIAGGLEALAHDFAVMWAQARGQQDRINRARWVEREMDDDNPLENAWEWFAGEDDYGPAPDDPPVPVPPWFEATRAPMFTEYERA